MPFPIINKIMKINKNNLWIRDIEDFMNELYFQDVISQDDKDYILDLISKNTTSNSEIAGEILSDAVAARDDLDDLIKKIVEIGVSDD
ncbi:MAG: hypothetical protein J6Y02_04360 [Pseudobutyrivibrio sp.]|nr:hypothetical protein [Pseudobutyrivibrio sp.]